MSVSLNGWGIDPVLGAEVAVGYVVAYVTRRARRLQGRPDAEIDRALGEAMERTHDLVARVLADDPAFKRAVQEAQEADAASVGVSERTRRRLTDSLDDAVEADPDLAAAVQRLVRELQRAATDSGTVLATGQGVAVGGSVTITADGGSVAAMRMGDVALGNPPVPGPPKS